MESNHKSVGPNAFQAMFAKITQLSFKVRVRTQKMNKIPAVVHNDRKIKSSSMTSLFTCVLLKKRVFKNCLN